MNVRAIDRRNLAFAAAACAALWGASTPAAAAGRHQIDISEVLEKLDSPRQNNEDAASIEDLLVHLVQDPNDVGAHINLGNLYDRAGRPDLAERAYHRAIKVDDHDPIAWNNLGVLYLRRGEVNQAASCFREALDQDPKYPVARYNLASIQDTRGDYDGALENFRVAFALRPELAEVRINPYVVDNDHLISASLINYLHGGPYSKLTEHAPDRLSQTIRGIAELVKRRRP
jgi:Tfp pilus assembly protein PilF